MKYIYLILFIFTSMVATAQGGKPEISADQVEVKVMKFYPNPATSVINFEFLKKLDKNYTLQIYNFVGKKVVEVLDVTQKTVVPLNDFFRGVYIYQLRDP